MPNTFPKMHRLVRPGEQGKAKVSHFTMTNEQADTANMGQAFSFQPWWMRVEPGKYARLVVDGELMMTDTPMEQRSNTEFVGRAHGQVLIAGLGLGMIVHAIMVKPEVTHVTVLEKSPDVVALVAPSLKKYKDRLTVITTDVHDYRPEKGQRYNVVYFDIWPDINQDNLPEMGKLQRRGHHWLDKSDEDRWVGCWLRNYLLAEKRRDQRAGW